MESEQFLEALLRLPAVYDAQVSDDGRWVAWSWYRAGPAADVYAAPTDGSAAPIRLTETPQNTTLRSWAPSGQAVLVAEDRDGNERERLFRVDLDRPGVLHPLTEADPRFFLRGGQLHPNGRWLVYAANWDEEAGEEIEPSWIYRQELATGVRRALARPERGCWYEPKLNAPGTHVLYQRNEQHPAGRQIWVVDIEGQEDREIYSAGADKKAWASWLPDGRRVLILAEAETHQRVGLWEMGSTEVRWLLDDPARNVESAYVPFGSRQAVLVEVDQARTQAVLLDVETGEETRLPAVTGNLVPLAPAACGGWVGTHYSSQQPADLVRFELEGMGPDSVVSLSRVWERTPLTPYDLAPAQELRWRSVDGLEIQGWLYQGGGEPRGAVVYVHGGPTWHSEDRVNPLIQYLVREGFCVLDPNYRGSTGFGRAFRQAIRASGWGGLEQEDIRTGMQALIATGAGKPGKIGITGTSYGGYSAWWAITHFPPDLVAAAAPICGMTDLVVDYETTRPDLRPLSEEMMGGSPAEVPERYRERFPLHFVGNIQGRLLIVQGLQDPNVTPENVRVVRDALEEAGIRYEIMVFEDEGHGIARPANHKVLYPRLAEFFGQMTAGDGE